MELGGGVDIVQGEGGMPLLMVYCMRIYIPLMVGPGVDAAISPSPPDDPLSSLRRGRSCLTACPSPG